METYLVTAVIPRGRRFTIWTMDAQHRVEDWFTFDVWKAALCREASTRGQRIKAETKDVWWGRELTHVELAEAA